MHRKIHAKVHPKKQVPQTRLLTRQRKETHINTEIYEMCLPSSFPISTNFFALFLYIQRNNDEYFLYSNFIVQHLEAP